MKKLVIVNDDEIKIQQLLKFYTIKLHKLGLNPEYYIVVVEKPEHRKSWGETVAKTIEEIKNDCNNDRNSVVILLDYELGGGDSREVIEVLYNNNLITEGDSIVCDSLDSEYQFAQLREKVEHITGIRYVRTDLKIDTTIINGCKIHYFRDLTTDTEDKMDFVMGELRSIDPETDHQEPRILS